VVGFLGEQDRNKKRAGKGKSGKDVWFHRFLLMRSCLVLDGIEALLLASPDAAEEWFAAESRENPNRHFDSRLGKWQSPTQAGRLVRVAGGGRAW
jgi:hypothetical protein